MQQKPQEIPINKGSRPDWQVRLGYPNAFNLFVGDSGYLYSTPGKTKIATNAPDQNARAVYYSKYKGGRYFVVTKNSIIYIKTDGTYKNIATIINSGQYVQIAENDQNQIGIVDGKKTYVISQRDNDAFHILDSSNGYNITTPISIVVLNTFTIILDRVSNTWIVSNANNMLSYPNENFPIVSDQSTQGVGLAVMNNNLYILGTAGIERWVPQTSNSPYLFAFAKDNNYQVPFGAISSAGISEGENEIFFLSSKFTPMVLNPNGYNDLLDPVSGFSRIVSQYSDFSTCSVSYSTFRGNSFLYMTFLDTGISWVYNKKSKTLHQVDDLVIDALQNYEVIALPDGIYKYSLTPDHKHRSFTTELIRYQKGIYPNRQLLNGVDLQIIQGLIQPDPEVDERIELTLSLDGQSWTNTVPRVLGKTGQRNAVLQWNLNLACQEVMYRFDYYGSLDLTISKALAYIL
jgi:hypothetical protein